MPTVDGTVGLREAAERLGVHYMTAYRYVRNGTLPAFKSGGEWQVDPADLAALSAERPAPSSGERPAPSRGERPAPSSGERPAPSRGERPAPSRGERPAPRVVHRERLERRLLAGDEAGAWGIVEAAMASGAEPAEVLTEMLSPSLRSIGQRWADGELVIADEHRASTVAQRLIARMGPRFHRPGRRKGTVVLGSVAGDRHSLPTAILSDLLRGAGLEVTDLGADCPAESFVDAVDWAGSPSAVGVCVTAPEAVASVPEVLTAMRSGGITCPVVLGGGAIGDRATALGLGADLWAGPVDEVIELFVALAAGPPPEPPDAVEAGE